MKIDIFRDSGPTVNLPVMIDTRTLICANSGGGKSYLVRKILEETAGKIPSIVLDIEGEFKTIREKFDFLLIGPMGDVELNPKAAHLLPRKLLELGISTIIDISDLKRHERVLYVKKFLEALMELPREFWKPTQIFLDEAHTLCGQQEKQESCGAVIDLMTRGRKRGFEGILATQRISKLHKDACAECNNIFIGRTGLDIDMHRAAEILGFTNKQDMLSLRDLEPGQFFVFGPAISRHVVKAKVGEVKTRHPKVGMDLRRDIVPPTAAIKAILSKLNDLPKEAEVKAKTEQDLRQRIKELEHQAKKPATPAVDAKTIDNVRQQAKVEAQRECRALQGQYEAVVKRLQKIATIADSSAAPVITKLKQPTEVRLHFTPQVTRKVYKPSPAKMAALAGGGEGLNLGRCERSILSLLYNNADKTFSKTLLGVFTEYSHKSGGFNNAICRLNALGLIIRNGPESIGFNPNQQSDTETILGDDINLYEQFNINNWARHLPTCESKIFQFLMQNPQTEYTKEEIGDAVDYSPGSGGFNNALCRLNSLGLIVRVSGRIKLNEEILAI